MIVTAKDLTVLYGERVALEEISFEVPEKAALSIVGPNGAGKSTILRVLLGLIRPDRGEVRVFGRDPCRTAAGSVGYVPQLKTLDPRFPALAAELVLSGLRRRWPGPIGAADRRKAMDALARVGAADLAKRPLANLSGGEMQRIYLARCLVGEPRLVLLDEPVTGVDAVGERDFYHHLEEYRDRMGATLVIITHDWQVASYHSTHVLVLNRRRIGFGPPAEALTEESLREAYGHLGHAHDELRGPRGHRHV
ncbi:MAG: ABC transporter ATP-binding protein [Candidatus Eisenbacteria bacterium]